MTQNMTKGNPLRLILLFSIPMLIGNLFQQLYNMADTFIVGRTIGPEALAAVGSTGSITFLIIGFAFGATTGMTIVTAQRYGAGDHAGVRRSLATSMYLSLGISLVLTAVSVVFVRNILTLMQTPKEIFEDAFMYLVIVLWGIVATMLFNLMSGFLRAVGNSKTPLYFLVFACLLNIVLDYVLILVLNMGVAGAAVATVVAQLVAGGLCARLIMRSGSPFRLTKEDFKVSAADIFEHLRVSLPMGFQSSIIAIGTVVLQFVLNGFGTEAVTAYTAAGKIDGMATLPLMTFGTTMATFVAQNYGAGLMNRIRKGVRQCAIVSVSIAVALGAVNVVFGSALAQGIFGLTDEVAKMAHTYLILNGASYSFLALLFVYRYSLQGLGASAVPTFAGAMELIMRAFAAVVLGSMFGYMGACFANPLAWLGSAVPLGISYYFTMRKMLQKAPGVTPQECVVEA